MDDVTFEWGDSLLTLDRKLGEKGIFIGFTDLYIYALENYPIYKSEGYLCPRELREIFNYYVESQSTNEKHDGRSAS